MTTDGAIMPWPQLRRQKAAAEAEPGARAFDPCQPGIDRPT
jgi:hypothetical protein